MRVALAQYYGSSDWMHLLLATGNVNADLVKAYNTVIDRRTPGGAHGEEPHIGARLSERSLAAAHASTPSVWGVQHTKSPEACAPRWPLPVLQALAAAQGSSVALAAAQGGAAGHRASS